MVRAIAMKDHKLFVRTRLLGVCEGENEWPARYAEVLHATEFSSTAGDLTGPAVGDVSTGPLEDWTQPKINRLHAAKSAFDM